MKLCIDCKFSDLPNGSTYHRCRRGSRVESVNPVSGKVSYRETYCDDERRPGRFWARMDGKCGVEGRFFAAIEPRTDDAYEELDAHDKALIDAAWERHKASLPLAAGSAT